MSKPTIFFSHSSRDQVQLARLKELFVHKTAGSIDVFLSSDGQSIPLGRNWVHQIEEALKQSSFMIVFVSPSSIVSNWLYFESGFAYSKGIRVVPVGFLGVDLYKLLPPLSLLQGFNIKSEAGLNNILALANDVFGHSHPESFTSEEFQHVCGISSERATHAFGERWNLINEITINLSQWGGLRLNSSNALTRIKTLLDAEGIDNERSSHAINLYGITFQARANVEEEPLQITVDPGLAHIALPIIERAIREIRAKDGVRGVIIRFDLQDTVDCLTQRHKITGRIYGSDVGLSSGDHLVRRDIRFRMLTSFGMLPLDSRSIPYIEMEMLADKIPTDQIADLISFLFDRGILFLASKSS